MQKVRLFSHVIYCMTAFFSGQRNHCILCIAQLKEVRTYFIGVFQSLRLALGSKALTINLVESVCKQKCCKTQ